MFSFYANFFGNNLHSLPNCRNIETIAKSQYVTSFAVTTVVKPGELLLYK